MSGRNLLVFVVIGIVAFRAPQVLMWGIATLAPAADATLLGSVSQVLAVLAAIGGGIVLARVPFWRDRAVLLAIIVWFIAGALLAHALVTHPRDGLDPQHVELLLFASGLSLGLFAGRRFMRPFASR